MLNENIRVLRKSKELSQEELAAKLNVVRQTISKWEKGTSVPDAEMIIKIAEALGTTVNTLLGETVSEEIPAESLQSLSEKLENLTREFAARAERNRRRWRIVFWILGGISLIVSGIQLFMWIQHTQMHAAIASTTTIIGGADGPTSILVGSRQHVSPLPLLSLPAFIIAGLGLYHTRRK